MQDGPLHSGREANDTERYGDGRRPCKQTLQPTELQPQLGAQSSSDAQAGEQLAIPVDAAPARSALSEPCDKCGAAAGDPCRTPGGRRVAYEHAARRRRARYLPVP